MNKTSEQCICPKDCKGFDWHCKACHPDTLPSSKDVALSLRELADKLPKQPVHLGLLQQALRGGAADIEQLRERVKDLQQFHDWAEPQVHDHGRDVLEIERLRVALRAALHPHSRECAYSKEWKRGVAPQCDCGIGALLLGEPSRDETSGQQEDKADLLAMAALIARLGRQQSYHVPAGLLKRASAVLVELADSRTTRRHRGCGSDCGLPAGHLGDHVPPEEPTEQLFRLRPLCICDNALTNRNPACPVHGDQT